MKKIYASFLTVALVFSGTAVAQNLQLNSIDAYTEANSTYLHEVKAHVGITNTGNDATYDVARIYNGSNGVADSNYFCWDLCYGVGTDSSTFGGVMLQNGVRNTDFYIGIYIRGNNATAQDSLIYRFYNAADPSDSLDITFYVSVSPTASTIEFEGRKVVVYPNPASDVVYVSTEQFSNGTVRLTNLAGVTVSRTEINGADRVAIDVRQVPSGVYMLQTMQNGSVQDAQRVVIAR